MRSRRFSRDLQLAHARLRSRAPGPAHSAPGGDGDRQGSARAIIHDSEPARRRAVRRHQLRGHPRTLLEAELFGFEQGAFTDARQAKPGLIQPPTGARCSWTRSGSCPRAAGEAPEGARGARGSAASAARARAGRVSIIAATNERSPAARRERRFREDLYHRLAVLIFTCRRCASGATTSSQLAERLPGPGLRRLRAAPKKLAPEDARRAAYRWPGNVRELANVMERAALLGGGRRHRSRPRAGRRRPETAPRAAESVAGIDAGDATGGCERVRCCRSSRRRELEHLARRPAARHPARHAAGPHRQARAAAGRREAPSAAPGEPAAAPSAAPRRRRPASRRLPGLSRSTDAVEARRRRSCGRACSARSRRTGRDRGGPLRLLATGSIRRPVDGAPWPDRRVRTRAHEDIPSRAATPPLRCTKPVEQRPEPGARDTEDRVRSACTPRGPVGLSSRRRRAWWTRRRARAIHVAVEALKARADWRHVVSPAVGGPERRLARASGRAAHRRPTATGSRSPRSRACRSAARRGPAARRARVRSSRRSHGECRAREERARTGRGARRGAGRREVPTRLGIRARGAGPGLARLADRRRLDGTGHRRTAARVICSAATSLQVGDDEPAHPPGEGHEEAPRADRLECPRAGNPRGVLRPWRSGAGSW